MPEKLGNGGNSLEKYDPSNGEYVEDGKPNKYYDNPKENRKNKQLEIILNTNPAYDDYHTWIRKVEDIKTFEEALNDSDWEGWEEMGFNPDYDGEMAKEALETGYITVYSSYPIEQGIFVTPSRMEAQSYAGRGKIFSKTVPLTNIAWIDPTQGQYADIDNFDFEKYKVKQLFGI